MGAASRSNAIIPSVTLLLAAVSVVVVGWFAAGTVFNIRKGTALMRWMQGGLPLLGERTTVRWLGSTAVEMVIRQAKAPFEQVTLVIFLEPRISTACCANSYPNIPYRNSRTASSRGWRAILGAPLEGGLPWP